MSNPKRNEDQAAAESAATPAPVVALSIDMLEQVIAKAVAAGVGAATKAVTAGADPELAQRVATSDSTMLELMRGMIELSKQQSDQAKNYNDAQRRQVRPSNAKHESISVFNIKPGCAYCDSGTRHPDDLGGMIGHPKPQFVIPNVYWPAGCPAVYEDFTVVEIELFNSLIALMNDSGIQVRTARHGTLTATMSMDRKTLVVDAPVYFTDQRSSLPELVVLLMALLNGTEVMTPESMYARMASLQMEVARLSSLLPKAPEPVTA